MLGIGDSVQLIEQAGDQLALKEGLFDDLIAVLQMDMGIERCV